MSTTTSTTSPATRRIARSNRQAFKKRAKAWTLSIILLVAMLITNMPLILTAINSLRPTIDILKGSTLFPKRLSLDNYVNVLQNTDFPTWFRNSIMIALITTGFTLICSGCAGYSLSRYKTKVNAVWSSILMAFQLFPIVLSVIALFVLFRIFGWLNTPMPAVILYVVMGLPFCTWMFKGFFDSIPRELEEAARVDGCTSFTAMYRIVLPLAGPGAAAVAIYAFLLAYNEYMVASAFLSQKQSVRTIPIGLRFFIQQYTTEWGQMLAVSTLAALPPLILFLLVQKWMIQGMAAGAVKG
ncbi:MAG: carbohydrate ABC transporter permease [Propionibacteriaceae bacterium]|jgi:ABC-type glycerol-3-phosphate transport system permease component|nr:carbohydrate ABC transporter permease [Propionibacteriaceae bacterium]